MATCSSSVPACTLTSQRKTHMSNQKLNTKPYSVYLFKKKKKTVHKNADQNQKLSIISQWKKVACMSAKSHETQNRTDLRRKKLKTTVNNSLEHRLHSSLQLKNKPQHDVLRRHRHHMQDPFSVSRVGADTQFSTSTANHLSGPRGKGMWYMWVSGAI